MSEKDKTAMCRRNRVDRVTQVAYDPSLPAQGDPIWKKGYPVVELLSDFLQEFVEE
jgi:hypothetical protein